MSLNHIRQRLHDRQMALGVSMSDPSTELIELAGRMGLDFVHFDGQHSPMAPERVGVLCQIADGYGITPTMRIPDKNASTIHGYLDKGVRVLVVPDLQTKEEAESLVQHAYFAPIGCRSATSIRTTYHQDEGDRFALFCHINMATMVVPQLESVAALENLDEILSVPGIDYYTSGFEDLAQSMGFPGEPGHPDVKAAWAAATGKIRAAGKKIYEEHVASVDVFTLIHRGLNDFLQGHDRTSELNW